LKHFLRFLSDESGATAIAATRDRVLPAPRLSSGKRLHRNVLVIALANKLAPIAWSVLARGRPFEASKLQAA
jgi:hypothetical protein